MAAKKDDTIRIRSDGELREALQRSADVADRKYADQARYLLRLALGLNRDRPSIDYLWSVLLSICTADDLRRLLREIQQILDALPGNPT